MKQPAPALTPIGNKQWVYEGWMLSEYPTCGWIAQFEEDSYPPLFGPSLNVLLWNVVHWSEIAADKRVKKKRGYTRKKPKVDEIIEVAIDNQLALIGEPAPAIEVPEVQQEPASRVERILQRRREARLAVAA